jgi:hypothetical protein
MSMRKHPAVKCGTKANTASVTALNTKLLHYQNDELGKCNAPAAILPATENVL